MSTEKKETGTEISDDPSGMWTEEEEQLLKEALKRYDDEMMDEYLTASDDEKPIPLTSEGRAKMKALLEQWVGPDDADQILNAEQKKYKEDLDRWKEKRQKRMRRHWRLWGSVAAAAIFTVIISVGNVQDSLAFKLPAAGFEAAVKDDYTQLKRGEVELEQNQDTEINQIDTRYSLGYVLEGYSVSDCIILSDLIIYIYKNSDKSYSFIQQVQNSQIFTNTEQQDGEFIQTMYGIAFYSHSVEGNSIVWQYQGYTFRIDGPLSKNDLLILLESLKKDPD